MDSKYMMFLSGVYLMASFWDFCEWGLCPKAVVLAIGGVVFLVCGLNVD